MASPGQALAEHLANLSQAPLQNKIGYMITLAALVAVLSGMWMWSKAPEYRILFSNLSDRDGGAVVAALNQMNVPYRIAENGGAILVPASQLHEARMKLAGMDLPRGGGVDGFNLIDKQKFGTSQFQEQINYQRALEGELSRSIQSLSAVQRARVHLALSRPSVFVRDAQKPSASVVLQLHPGRILEPDQVNAIVNLVSSSVPDMPSKAVTVVDQSGTLLSNTGALAHGLDPAQVRHVRDLEAHFSKRIEALVSAIVGPGNVRAHVTAEVDFSRVERAGERFKPNAASEAAALRSTQVTESIQSGPTPGIGAPPGAASNQPPQPAAAPITAPPGTEAPTQAPPAPGAAPPVASSQQKSSTTNYEVDKEYEYVQHASGNIRRLSAAVVVNHRSQPDEEGKPVLKPLTDQEKNQISEIVKHVMGFNEQRGDTLNLVNAPFSTPAPAPAEEIPLWKSPELLTHAQEIGRNLLIAGIALYLVLGVLRPMLRTFAEPPPTPPELLPAPAALPPDPAQQAVATYEANLQTAKQIARTDPKLVANVVKGWVTNNG